MEEWNGERTAGTFTTGTGLPLVLVRVHLLTPDRPFGQPTTYLFL